MQLLDKANPKEILRYLGQARLKLAKEETLQESLRAALGCADVYRSMGMLWASRNVMFAYQPYYYQVYSQLVIFSAKSSGVDSKADTTHAKSKAHQTEKPHR
jgi:hypothetical protein